MKARGFGLSDEKVGKKKVQFYLQITNIRKWSFQVWGPIRPIYINNDAPFSRRGQGRGEMFYGPWGRVLSLMTFMSVRWHRSPISAGRNNDNDKKSFAKARMSGTAHTVSINMSSRLLSLSSQRQEALGCVPRCDFVCKSLLTLDRCVFTALCILKES